MSQRVCSMCEQPVQLMSDDPYHVDTGLHMTINTGYGMFADGLAQDLITCHACSIRLLSLFPQRVRDHYHGGHDHDYPGAICTGCEYNDFSSDDFKPTLEELWEIADQMMSDMDLPEDKRRDTKWLALNAYYTNRNNPNLLPLTMVLVDINEAEQQETEQ